MSGADLGCHGSVLKPTGPVDEAGRVSDPRRGPSGRVSAAELRRSALRTLTAIGEVHVGVDDARLVAIAEAVLARTSDADLGDLARAGAGRASNHERQR